MSIKGGVPGRAVGLVRSAQVAPGQLPRLARSRPRIVRSVVLEREVLSWNTDFGLCLEVGVGSFGVARREVSIARVRHLRVLAGPGDHWRR
jgi:hypothetical protein